MHEYSPESIVTHELASTSLDSVPLGNGDIGLNLWVEACGDLVFYLSKTDAWNENLRLLKLGRVRISLFPALFQAGGEFCQELQILHGALSITDGAGTRIRAWVDANRPVVYVEVWSEKPIDARISLETWRNHARILQGLELFSSYTMWESPGPVPEFADVILEDQKDCIVWYHRNETSIWPASMKLQGLEEFMQYAPDPLTDRIFGGVLQGDGLESDTPDTLKTTLPVRHLRFEIHLLTEAKMTPRAWVDHLHETVRSTRGRDVEAAWKAHCGWWARFWGRSHVVVAGGAGSDAVTRGYCLQRYMNACAGRGAYPIKFNGSIFTTDPPEGSEGLSFGADFRGWGGPYWFQNTRLIYWPMLASGDFDLLQPFFRMYSEALDLAKYRTKRYYGHTGAFFPETMCFWGANANTDYGWDRTGKKPGEVVNPFIRYYWSGGLELCGMMLACFEATQDADFLETTLLPIAEGILDFYGKHYPRREDGRIRLEPAASLETWHDVVDPLPEIAGLRDVLARLRLIPEGLVPERNQAEWKELEKVLPEIPIRHDSEGGYLLPAERLIETVVRNTENPELYAIFPYRIFGVGKPGLETALRSFHRRRIHETGGWRQDAIQAAYLGLTEVARDDVVQNFSTSSSDHSFPAFWGPNMDWVPDQDHGGVASIALQAMLMQSDRDEIRLFPAWPKEWDVDFKLHAPQNTVVEGVLRGGRLLELHVAPESRLRDVHIPEDFH
jgi:alpha-L-fucosidase 2